MNKSLIRVKQIVNSVIKAKKEIAEGKCEKYTLDEFLTKLNSKKKLRILKLRQ